MQPQSLDTPHVCRQVKGEVRHNGAGVRALLATEDIARFQLILRIPPEAILHVGDGYHVRTHSAVGGPAGCYAPCS